MPNLITRKELDQGATLFFSKVFDNPELQKLADYNWSIDHICYRVATEARYLECKSSFESFATLLVEYDVNGRPIATYKLAQPLKYKERIIDLIELPAPKAGKHETEGFEHIEMIVDKPFSDIILENPRCDFDMSGLSKTLNQELKLKLGDFQVKFHYLSLESVIAIESNNRITGCLQDSQILQKLNDYSPLIAGTFPLNLHNHESDIDIIATSNDFQKLSKTVRDNFGHESGFYESFSNTNDEKSYFASFSFNFVPIEIFAQNIASVRQRAYRHFQLEERILKLGGVPLRHKLSSLRESGIKTEAAFATVLGLRGDPFTSLFTLNNLTDIQLINKIQGTGEAPS